MRVLFIGKRFYTNRDAVREQFGRIYQLPRHWAEMGSDIRLWLVDYHSRERVQLMDVKLDVVSLPVFGWASLARFCKEAFRRRPAGVKEADVVVASGDCYLGLMAYFIARRTQARFVFDVYDKYDEFPTYRRFFGFDLFQFLLHRADNLLFASRALMERISNRPKRDFIVPNGVDRQRFRPLDLIESRRSLELPEDVILVGYFGSMEPDRGVDDLIAAVQELRGTGMTIELLLGGKSRPDLALQQAGIRYVGNVPFDRVPAMLASCDLLAVPYRQSTFMDAGASNKIAEAIACGRPLIATRTPNFMANFPDQAIRLDKLLADPGDAADIARVIRAQLARPVLVDMPPGMDWQSIATALAVQLSLPLDGADSIGQA